MSSTLLVANYAPDVGFAWWLMQRFWLEFAEACRESGRDCYLAYPGKGEVPSEIRDSHITPIFLDFTVSGGDRARQQSFIRKHDVTEIYYTDHPFRHLRYRSLRRAGVKTIINHDHTPGDRPAARGVRRLLKCRLNAWKGWTCDSWIAISPLMYERAIENACIARENCVIVQNGIDPIDWDDEGRRQARAQLGLASHEVAVVLVGRATKYKGLDFFVRAATEAQRRFPGRFKFFHIGEGPFLEQAQRMATFGASESSVRFMGKRNDVRTLLPGFDVALHPAHGEGFSLAILEYMSAGLVPLLPDTPSVRQAVVHGRSGLIFENGSLHACLAQLLHAAEPDRRHRLGRAAAQVVEDSYSWSRTRAEFRAFLDDLRRSESW